MSNVRITLEISSITQANALIAALGNFLDCSEDRFKDETEDHAVQRAAGKQPDWHEVRDLKTLGEHIKAARELLKALGAPRLDP